MNENSGDTYGECRCCLAVGHHRDIQKVYLLNGVREVYYEIFVKCFNLNLSTNMSLTPLICMNCVDRLRDAASFRDMAASTEKQLLSALSSAGKKSTVFVNVEELRSSTSIDVKEESQIKLEPDDFVLDLDSLDDYEADVIEDGKTNEDLVPGEADLVARFAHVSPLPTPGDLVTIVPEYARHLTMLKEFTVPANRILELLREHKIEMDHHSSPQKLYVTEKFAHMVNITTLLEYSNITPFKSKSRCGFPCLYCRAICDNLDKLRVHTAQHKKAELSKILRRYGAECLVVYADITDLRCSLCESNIRTLNDLKSHLINTHKKKIYTEFTDRIIPYKLGNENGYECQLCGFTFETFGSIERHMNVHFRNYICKECGSGFVTKYRLKVHGKSMHADGSYPCESCGKIFNTLQKYKNHVNSVHKMMKRFKCTKCPERFSEYFKRQKHMVQIHGVAPLQYRCNVCDKCFDRKYTLSRHMKRDHLEERDFQCEVCPYKCFTKNELQIHMIKHNGERIYECSVCKKSYARKKTLKEHMRIHNNDRRFSCAVCGQAFVQKCSLKGHLKTHHLEYNLQ